MVHYFNNKKAVWKERKKQIMDELMITSTNPYDAAALMHVPSQKNKRNNTC